MTKAQERKAAAMVRKVFNSLPKRIVCPKCHKNRTPKAFGMRVCSRDENGFPKDVRRQSYCKPCRR